MANIIPNLSGSEVDMVTLKSIRESILKERGLAIKQPKERARRQFVPRQQATLHYRKTMMMEYLELKYGDGQSIWDILISGSLNVVVKRFNGEVDRSTISRWIDRYNLRYDKTNLPECRICSHYNQIHCDQGTCILLINMEEWELVLVKKSELLAGNTGNRRTT